MAAVEGGGKADEKCRDGNVSHRKWKEKLGKGEYYKRKEELAQIKNYSCNSNSVISFPSSFKRAFRHS